MSMHDGWALRLQIAHRINRSGLCCWFLFCGPRQTAHRYGFILGLLVSSSDFEDVPDNDGVAFIFGGGGLNLLLTALLFRVDFLLGVLISGKSDESESTELLPESVSELDSLPSLLLSLSLLESSSSLLLPLLLLPSLSEAISARRLRYRSERRISCNWNGFSSAVLIG